MRIPFTRPVPATLPSWRADPRFTAFQDEASATEQRLSAAREAVREVDAGERRAFDAFNDTALQKLIGKATAADLDRARAALEAARARKTECAAALQDAQAMHDVASRARNVIEDEAKAAVSEPLRQAFDTALQALVPALRELRDRATALQDVKTHLEQEYRGRYGYYVDGPVSTGAMNLANDMAGALSGVLAMAVVAAGHKGKIERAFLDDWIADVERYVTTRSEPAVVAALGRG